MLKGADAVNGYSDAASDAEQARQKILGTMNPAEALVFDDASRRLVDGQVQQFGQHAAQQQWHGRNDSITSAITANTQSAIANKDNPAQLQSTLNNIGNTVDLQAKANGWTPDMTAQAKQTAQSGALVLVIKAKAQNDPMGAYSFYSGLKGQLTPSDQLDAESILRPQVEARMVQDSADTVLGGVPGNVSTVVTSEAQKQGVDLGLANDDGQAREWHGCPYIQP